MRGTSIRIHGKRLSEEQIANEIFNLISGEGPRPYPLTPTEVAKILGISRDTVYRYIKKLQGEKKILKLNSGKLLLPKQTEESKFKRFNSSHPITGDPLVADWMDDLVTRKNGAPIVKWRDRIRGLESVCNTCKVNPQDLIVSTKKTERIMRTFAKFYQQGTVFRSKAGAPSKGFRTGIYRRVQAVRDFCSFYDLTWRRGVNGIMSQKVPEHGKYGDIRLTASELEQADTFIKERWGLDSDIYRWFWVGIESCARFEAMYNMSLDYTKHQSSSGRITYIMTAIETKTQHIRGGKWFKYITRKDTQQSIDILKQRGKNRIYESTLAKYKFRKMISEQLKQIYQHLGKNTYFQSHTTHALRHVGAHYWLSKTNYNFGLIAEVGGWNTMDELKKSYGQIPPEKILEIIE